MVTHLTSVASTYEAQLPRCTPRLYSILQPHSLINMANYVTHSYGNWHENEANSWWPAKDLIYANITWRINILELGSIVTEPFDDIPCDGVYIHSVVTWCLETGSNHTWRVIKYETITFTYNCSCLALLPQRLQLHQCLWLNNYDFNTDGSSTQCHHHFLRQERPTKPK